MRTVWIVIACLVFVGCGDDADAPAAPPPPSGPSVPQLAAAWTTEAPPEPWLVVAYHDVSMGEGEPILTLEDRRVRAADRVSDGYLVRPLHERLTATAAGPLGVAIDPEIPFRTVSEIVFTLGHAERTELAFVVRSGDSTSALPVEIPALGRAREGGGEVMLLGALGGDDGAFADVLRGGALLGDADDLLASADGEPAAPPTATAPDRAIEPRAVPSAITTSLNLSLTVTARGIMVAGAGGFLAPGCEEIAPRAVAVPVRDGLQDRATLARCLERVHREFPEEDQVIVSADPDVAFRDVAGAMATARGTAARPLFPRLLISAGVR